MVAPGKLELDAIGRMFENVALVREEILLKASEPNVTGILLTLADPYSITKDTWARIQKEHPGLLMKTIIPKNNDLQKAIGRAQSVFEVARQKAEEQKRINSYSRNYIYRSHESNRLGRAGTHRQEIPSFSRQARASYRKKS